MFMIIQAYDFKANRYSHGTKSEFQDYYIILIHLFRKYLHTM